MTTTPPTSSHLVPASSPGGDDLPGVTSSLVPHPYRGRGHTEAVETPLNNTTPARPRDEFKTPSNTYLVTARTKPFWEHTLHLLDDGAWHHRDELHALGKHHGLADRTIANLLPRASKRRWIERSRGYVRIRDRAALDAALDLSEARS